MNEEPTADMATIPAAELVALRGLAGQMTSLETSTGQALIERDLSAALADHALTPGALPKLIRLLRDDLEAKRDASGWKVGAKDGKTVGEHVKGYLANPENFMFLKSTARPGAGGGGDKPGPNGGGATVQPKSYGEAMILAAKANPTFDVPAFQQKYIKG